MIDVKGKTIKKDKASFNHASSPIEKPRKKKWGKKAIGNHIHLLKQN